MLAVEMGCTATRQADDIDREPMQVFGALRTLEARSLAGPALEVQVPAGTELIREGEQVGTFYVIRSGDAELSAAGRGTRGLHAGDCFGEIDPVSPEGQRFTITATSPMRLLTFSAFGIARLCSAIPAARPRIMASLPQL
jgi:CRP-like cAMP-binding protein